MWNALFAVVLLYFLSIVDFSLFGLKLLLCFCTYSVIYFSSFKIHATKMQLNGISSSRSQLELAVPKILISRTRIKSRTVLSSLN